MLKHGSQCTIRMATIDTIDTFIERAVRLDAENQPKTPELPKIQIANVPSSWGILEFNKKYLLPYTQVLQEMAEAGYSGTELGAWGYMPTDSATLQGALSAYKLTLLGGDVYVSLSKREAHAAGEAAALQMAHLLLQTAGTTCFVVLSDEVADDEIRTKYAGRIRPEQSLKQDGWKIFAEGVNRIAQVIRDQTGLRTVFHPHTATWVETPGEVETLMSLTDPSLVGLCLDTGEYVFGSGEPLEALNQFRERIWHIHFKDVDASEDALGSHQGWNYFTALEEGIFTELGQGEVAFPFIVKALNEFGYTGWIVVEQDVLPSMGTPLESATRNREYLKTLGL